MAKEAHGRVVVSGGVEVSQGAKAAGIRALARC